MEFQLYKNIISDPDICNGKPVIKNTRVTVQVVISYILAGDEDIEILRSFPRLKKDDLQSCKSFLELGIDFNKTQRK